MFGESSEEEEQTPLEKKFDLLCEEANKKKLEALNYVRLISFAFYVIVFLCVGVPVWWRTTTPERWPLPDVSQLMVKSQTLEQYYKISIVCLEPQTVLDLDEIRSVLRSAHPMRSSFDGALLFKREWKVRTASDNELVILQEHLNKSHNNVNNLLTELDESLSKIHGTNSILFYVLPKTIQTKRLFNVGHYRSYFVDPSHLPKDSEMLSSDFASLVYSEVELTENIAEKFYHHLEVDNDEDTILLMSQKFDLMVDIIYEAEFESNYNETNLSRLQAERKAQHHQLMGHIETLTDFFQQQHHPLSRYFRVNIVPQVLHYVWSTPDFIDKELVLDESSSGTNRRLLPVSSVEKLLTQIESRRVQLNDNLNSYHLVLYVCSSKKTSIQFLNGNQTSNLITTPYRGSILILNEHQRHDLYFGLRQLLHTFFRLTKSANEVQKSQPTFPAKHLTLVPQLELEACVRALVQRQILQTLRSLESTEKLLTKVSNMVIQQKISNWLHDAMDNSLRAAELLSTNGNIMAAYQHSLVGFNLSERAFFDPSLLSLLYFPDDQKYAIYLPLFLPIMLPFFVTIKFFLCQIIES